MGTRAYYVPDIYDEMKATQFWMRELFVIATAPDCRQFAQFIRDRIKSVKSALPPEGMTDADYDDASLARIPHIERIGEDIIEWLDNAAAKSDK